MQHLKFPLKAGTLDFHADVFVPEGTGVKESQTLVHCYHPVDQGMGLMRLSCSDHGLFAFLGLMQGLPGREVHPTLADDLLGTVDDDSPATMTRLAKLVLKHGQSLKCLILEVRPADQEDPEDYYLARVFAAGMPPLLLIDAGNYRIPTRAGIPLGIAEGLEQPFQSLEWDRGGILHFHTDLSGVVNMEALHQDLVESRLEGYGEAIHVRLKA